MALPTIFNLIRSAARRQRARLFVLAHMLAWRCSPVTVLNRLALARHAASWQSFSYGLHARMQLDVYRPRVDVQKAPVVVFFYGGSWSTGKREHYRFVGHALAERGFVTVIADYRLFPEVRYPDFLDDCAAAIDWTFREITAFGGDPVRVFLAGHSAGAYNAAMLAYDPRWQELPVRAGGRIAGMIGLAGPYNFLPIVTRSIKPVFNFPHTSQQSQPLTHVRAGLPPTLLVAASKDHYVCTRRNTLELASKLRVHGVPVVVKVYTQLSHETVIAALGAPLRDLAPLLEDVAGFISAQDALM